MSPSEAERRRGELGDQRDADDGDTESSPGVWHPSRQSVETARGEHRQAEHAENHESRRRADEIETRQPVDVGPQAEGRRAREPHAEDDQHGVERGRLIVRGRLKPAHECDCLAPAHGRRKRNAANEDDTTERASDRDHPDAQRIAHRQQHHVVDPPTNRSGEKQVNADRRGENRDDFEDCRDGGLERATPVPPRLNR